MEKNFPDPVATTEAAAAAAVSAVAAAGTVAVAVVAAVAVAVAGIVAAVVVEAANLRRMQYSLLANHTVVFPSAVAHMAVGQIPRHKQTAVA